MKFKVSKKLIVSSLASVMAVSLVGAVTGTVAWYQYNTRVTTSLIGLNVAETGVLQISTAADSGFTSDLITSDLASDVDVTPMTWDLDQPAAAVALTGAKGYKNPNYAKNREAADADAGHAAGSYADVYQLAGAGDYIQFTVYLQAKTVDNVDGGFNLKAEDIYLEDFVLEDIGSDLIASGLRVHLAIDAANDGTDEVFWLLSKGEVSALPLSGYLDQDDDGVCDRVGGYEWATGRDATVTYGHAGYTQTTTQASAIVGETTSLFTTVQEKVAKVTVTIWLEGWATSVGTKAANLIAYDEGVILDAETSVTGKYELNDFGNYVLTRDTKADGVKKYYTQSSTPQTVADWSGYHTDGAKFKFGMTFGVKENAFND